MPGKMEIVVFGKQQFVRKMETVAARVNNAEPYLEMVMADIERIEGAMFSSQGRRGGGSWKGLSKETIATKLRKDEDPRINIATGQLLRSVTSAKANHAVREITRSTLRFGTTAPGADQSQKHRPIFRFTKFDRSRWAEWWAKYIVEAFSA